MTFEKLRAIVPDEAVLKKLNCDADSHLYEDFLEELSEIRVQAENFISPKGSFAFGTLPEELATKKFPAGSPLACVILTLGNEISDYCTGFFKEGDCVKGMLADSFADTYLFELEKSWTSQLIEACRKRNFGIERRLEIPGDLPMEAQKFAYETIGEEELAGLTLTSGYMLVPVKSICLIFLLSEGKSEYHTEHDCRRCSNLSCNMRSVRPVKIGVLTKEGRREVVCQGGQKLLDALAEERISVSAVCGGRGTCGKCRVRLLAGETELSSREEAYFSKKELEEGWRLACQAYPLTDCEIEVQSGEEGFQVLAGDEKASKEEEKPERTEACGIAVDIGTTTLAAQLVDLKSGSVLETEVCVNHQRSWGADVLSRIQASNEGKKEELRESIQKDLGRLFSGLLQKSGLPPEKLKKIFLAGNTTMEHLLLGYSCQELGRLPFRPVTLEPPSTTVGLLLGESFAAEAAEFRPLFDTPVVLLPGISAFVGADITAGLLSCAFDREEGYSLLIDLGTNGEMAVGSREKLYVTSTAAGPAFEGGAILWGCGSAPGAITHVEIDEEGKAKVKTIGDKPPVGICGTGLIAAAAELLERGFMDETGRMEKKYAEDGFPLAKTGEGETILLTQKDIRELQLAKAAVRAGMEILLKTAGVKPKDMSRVWLAGGFGTFADWKKAATIGLLPEEFLDRIESAGNSSLNGTRMALVEAAAWERLKKLQKRACEVSLGGSKEFQEAYMDAIYFE